MRVKRVVVGVCAVAVSAASAAVSAGCGASATVDPIAQAADVTQQLPGAQMRFTERLATGALPQPITITGAGYVNQRQKAGALTFDFSSIPGASKLPGAKTARMLFQFPVIYMKFGFLAGQTPGHKAWLKIDLQKAGQAGGINFSQLAQSGGSDPSQYLNFLRGSGSVKKVGSEAVNGIAATHYSAIIELSRIADRAPASQRDAARSSVAQLQKLSGGRGSLPVDVWVDAKRRVRREKFTMHVPLPNGTGTLDGAITVDYLSFGATPQVTPPPASQVFDATAQAAAGLKKATGK